MAQYDKPRRWSVRRTQDRRNAVAMAIMKCQGFFHTVVIRSSGPQKTYFDMLELRWPERVAQQENTPTGCSNRPNFSPSQPRRAKTSRSAGKPAGESKPEAYPRGFDRARTLLADCFNILLLGLEKIEMIRRAGTVTDC
jgi:hypothetical protein